MEADRRTELYWISSSSSSLSTTSDASGVSEAAAHIVWSSAVQPEMQSATSQAAGAWDQLLDQRTGSGNNSDGGATSRVETDDNTNWSKEGDAPPDARPSSSLLSYGVDRLPQEVTSEMTGSRVFSEAEYQVLRRHVLQGDLDDHVIPGDRSSLDSRKLMSFIWPCCLLFARQSNCPRYVEHKSTLCPRKVSHLMFDNNFGKCGPIFKN